MWRHVAARLGQAIVVLWIVATLAFLLIHAAPGDPFSYESARLTDTVRARMLAQAGYDRPVAEQYVRYLANVARGELGYSTSLHEPVRDALANALPNTLLLMSVAIFASFGLGIWLALYQVRYHGRWRARAAGGIALLLYSLPDFWFALLLQFIFALWILALPVGGAVDVVMHGSMTTAQAVLDRVQHLILPALTLTLLSTAWVTRFQRNELLEVLPLDFIRTARAKGLAERDVLWRHALRNALIPTLTLAGLSFPALLGGSVFVETVFSWPGMGYLTTNAISARDYPLVMAAVIIGAMMVAIGNLIADVAYVTVDPRLRGR